MWLASGVDLANEGRIEDWAKKGSNKLAEAGARNTSQACRVRFGTCSSDFEYRYICVCVY